MKTYKQLIGRKIQVLIMTAVFISIGLTGYFIISLIGGISISKFYLIAILGFTTLSLLLVAFLYSALLDKLTQNEERYFATKEDLLRVNKNAKHQEKLEKLLQVALENDELTIFYQPRISSKTGRICSAEALVRWFHADFGWISPDEFIPIAEKSDLILKLGHWVLKMFEIIGKVPK